MGGRTVIDKLTAVGDPDAQMGMGFLYATGDLYSDPRHFADPLQFEDPDLVLTKSLAKGGSISCDSHGFV